MTTSPTPQETVGKNGVYPLSFWPALVLGGIVMAVGVRGLLVNANDTDPRGWLALFLASALLHDFLFAPLVMGAGVLLARVVPARIRAVVTGGLIISGVVVLFAWPFVRGWGRQSGNPSILPLNYARGLLGVLAGIWLVVTVLALWRWWRPGGQLRDAPTGDDPTAGAGPMPGSTSSIADHALLSDCQGAALVDRTGSVTWACLPRFDSPAIFSRILDPSAGHWRIGPTGHYRVSRQYVDRTLVLNTVFRTDTGAVSLTDALVFEPDEREHSIGKRSPHTLVRVLEGLEGTVELELELALRPEYGLTTPTLLRFGAGLRARGGPFSFVVSSDVDLEVDGGTARAFFGVDAGEKRVFSLAQVSPWEDPPEPQSSKAAASALEGTVDGWRSWSELHQRYEGPYAEQVHLGGRVLRALTHVPTGAIVAAPTTSLPETVGGGRNWDYRIAWVRDASLTVEALWVAACPDEASRFFDFFVTAAGGSPGERSLQVMYGIGGERDVTERELDHLQGHLDSRPVRVGNGASDQVQLDIYGGLLNAAFVLADQLGKPDEATASFLIDLAELAVERWDEPDHGIWEGRGDRQHFLYSKLMCWVGLDRVLRLAPRLGAEDRVGRWEQARADIRSAIEERGWNTEVGAYTQAFGSDVLDAAALVMPIVGFVEAGDPRMRATIEAIARELTDDRGFVYRYRTDDLEGEEGTFGICTAWLAHCHVLLGRFDRARALIDLLVVSANDVGLLPEEFGPGGELLGNFPQAFTHVGLVNAVWALAQAEQATSGTATVAEGETVGA